MKDGYIIHLGTYLYRYKKGRLKTMKKQNIIFIASVVFSFLGVASGICLVALGGYTGRLSHALIGMLISGSISALFFWLSNSLFNIYLHIDYIKRRAIIEKKRRENDKARLKDICRQIGINSEVHLEVINGGKFEESSDSSSTFTKGEAKNG